MGYVYTVGKCDVSEGTHTELARLVGIADWKAFEEYLNQELVVLDKANRKVQPESETAVLRGEIRFAERLLRLRESLPSKNKHAA